MMGSILHALTVAAFFVSFSQIGLVFSQDCGREAQDSCCEATGRACPSGYYRADNCDPTFEDGEESNTTDNGVTDSTTNTTDSSFTEETVTEVASTSTSTPSIFCKRCSSNCHNCNATACLQCAEGYVLDDGECEEEKGDNSLPIAAIAGGAAGGTVLIVVIIIVVVCCCRRRPCCRRNNGSGTETLDNTLENRQKIKDGYSEDVSEAGSEEPSTSGVSHHTYQNTAYQPDNMSTQIEQGQDKMFRYTRDPTVKKPEYVEEPIYANRVIIDSKIINELGEAPAPPAQHKKAPAKSPDPIEEEEDEPEEIYYNQSADRNPDLAHEDEEVYYNEGAGREVGDGEEEELYVNYNP